MCHQRKKTESKLQTKIQVRSFVVYVSTQYKYVQMEMISWNNDKKSSHWKDLCVVDIINSLRGKSCLWYSKKIEIFINDYKNNNESTSMTSKHNIRLLYNKINNIDSIKEQYFVFLVLFLLLCNSIDCYVFYIYVLGMPNLGDMINIAGWPCRINNDYRLSSSELTVREDFYAVGWLRMWNSSNNDTLDNIKGS